MVNSRLTRFLFGRLLENNLFNFQDSGWLCLGYMLSLEPF